MTARTIGAALAAMALSGTAAHADDGVHVALVGGLGLAQGQFGGHLELRKQHFAIFAGSGTIFSTTLQFSRVGFPVGDGAGGPSYGAVFGARWYSGASGDHFFLSTQFGFNTQRFLNDPGEGFPPAWHHSNATTLTGGWRFKWGAFLLDAGAGGGVVFNSNAFGGGYKADAVPDLTLAIGFEL